MTDDGRRMRFEVLFEPRDLWVGVFWDLSRGLDVYVCPVPTLCLHWYRRGSGRQPWWARS
jgi:hypothetical protein